MISFYIERFEENGVRLEGRTVPNADVARFIQVGRKEFAMLTEETAKRYGLWEDDE